MDLGLKDRVAFVTGATNEIGRAVCLGLIREGAKVAFSDINVEKGEQVVAAAKVAEKDTAHDVATQD